MRLRHLMRKNSLINLINRLPMKRLFITIVCAALAMSHVSAQVRIDRGYDLQVEKSHKPFSFKPALKFGLKAGAVLSDIDNRMAFDPEFQMGLGYHAGLVLNLHWGYRTEDSVRGTGFLGVQPEVLYVKNIVRSAAGNVQLHNVQIPLMLKFYPLAQLSIEAGPEFSYMIAVSPAHATFGDVDMNLRNCSGFHFGAGAGLAYEFRFGLLLGARYSIRFTDLAGDLQWRDKNAVQASVGWLF